MTAAKKSAAPEAPEPRFTLTLTDHKNDVSQRLGDIAMELINEAVEHFDGEELDCMLHALIGIQERVQRGMPIPLTLREFASLLTLCTRLK